MQTLYIYSRDCWIFRPLFAHPQFLNRSLLSLFVSMSVIFFIGAFQCVLNECNVSVYSVRMPHWIVIVEYNLTYDRIRFYMPLFISSCAIWRGKKNVNKTALTTQEKKRSERKWWKENEIEIAYFLHLLLITAYGIDTITTPTNRRRWSENK